MSDYRAGLVVLIGQITDSITQPIISYCSDNIDSRIGKRMFWFVAGNLVMFPLGAVFYNPSSSVLGVDDLDVASPSQYRPCLAFFLLTPTIMNVF